LVQGKKDEWQKEVLHQKIKEGYCQKKEKFDEKKRNGRIRKVTLLVPGLGMGGN